MDADTKPALMSLEDYDQAIADQNPGEAGLSHNARLTRFVSLQHLHRGRARVWSELADRYVNDVQVPWELVAAARRCAGHDRLEAARWEKHHAGVAKQR